MTAPLNTEARGFSASAPGILRPGTELWAVLAHEADRALVLLADTRDNTGASMTNTIEAVIDAAVHELLKPRGLRPEQIEAWVEFDSMECFDLVHPRFSNGRTVTVRWAPLTGMTLQGDVLRRSLEAFILAYGDYATAAFTAYEMECRRHAPAGSDLFL